MTLHLVSLHKSFFIFIQLFYEANWIAQYPQILKPDILVLFYTI